MILSNAILVDTSAYYALKDKDDVYHNDAFQFVKTNTSPLATTNLIVIETLNLVKQRLGYQHAVEIGKKMFDPRIINVIKITDEDIDEAWRIFQKYDDKGFSFTDCTTFAVTVRLKISSVFAFDEHFRQYGKFVVHPALS
jgi:predicted nucleic acid-binding protein